MGCCPFLALWVQQRAANGGKRRHKAKVENRRILRVMTRDPATSSTPPQRAANVFFFRLLTGGLLVRIQPEEPIFFENSTTFAVVRSRVGPRCPFLALSLRALLPSGAAVLELGRPTGPLPLIGTRATDGHTA